MYFELGLFSHYLWRSYGQVNPRGLDRVQKIASIYHHQVRLVSCEGPRTKTLHQGAFRLETSAYVVVGQGDVLEIPG